MGNNNDTSGIAYLFIFAGLAAIGLFFYVVAMAVIFAIVSLLALKKPLKMGKVTYYPSEARGYLIRGVLGLILAPIVAGIVAGSFGIALKPEWDPYVLAGGFTFASMGVQYIKQGLGILCPEERALPGSARGRAAPAGLHEVSQSPEGRAPELCLCRLG